MSAPDTSLTDDEMEQIDEAGEAVEEGVEGSGKGFKWYARLYITGFVLLLIGSLAGAIALDIIQPEIVVTATAEIGWIVEYVVAFLVAVFALWTVSMLLIALPGSFISGMISAIARIADAYELPSRNDDE